MNVLVTGDPGLIASGVIAELRRRGHVVSTEGAVIHIESTGDVRITRSTTDSLVIRTAAVYGPGDEVISPILKLVRTLPALPVIDDGDEEFRPIWFEDFAKAIVNALERTDLTDRTLEVAGNETTSINDLIRRVAELTERRVVKIPTPIKLTMHVPRNMLTGENALQLLGVEPTPLDRGLRILADSLPELLPDEGVGAMHHKHYHADITGSRHTAQSLMTLFRDRATEFIPLNFDAEPGTPNRLDRGATLTAHLPLRGNIQVRVECVEPMRVVLATIEGHPLAGTLQFSTEAIDGGVRFAIDLWARASNFFDLIGMNTLGRPLQDANWRVVVQNVIDASGGIANDGVQSQKETLDDEAAARVEERIRKIVQARKRAEDMEETWPQR
ncbi:MAG: NAD-dependent epimerase/dehydratase [Acidobacteria bacterium]|nr:NAD-dependent epimerase/dehydratase [Acidobacteriota bacterium]